MQLPELVATALHQPGSTIGPYKLLEQIGEGGFETVYTAQQDMPFHTHENQQKILELAEA